MSDISRNIEELRSRIGEIALGRGRKPEEIVLVGASKTVDAERVAEAIAAGLTDLGENFVQEASTKIPAVRQLATRPVRWHMIGHLQSNKVKAALECFDVIETVDSARLAQSIARRAGDSPVEVLLEVYLGTDTDRPGIRGDALPDVVAAIATLPGLHLRGLMTVAPLGLDDDSIRQVFRTVRELRDRLAERHPILRLDTLSMGMSDDYPIAIEEGATHVRVGRAIFGARPSLPSGS